MYTNGQTLVHKTSKKLVRLSTDDTGLFAWDIGPKTRFVGENGKTFVDNIDNYVHIENRFGKILPGNSDWAGPDMSLKPFV